MRDPMLRLPPDARAKLQAFLEEQADIAAILQSHDQKRHQQANELRDAESFNDRVQLSRHSSGGPRTTSMVSTWLTRGTPNNLGIEHYQPPKGPPDAAQLSEAAQAVETARAALQATSERIATVQARRSKLAGNLLTWLQTLPPHVKLESYQRPAKAAAPDASVEAVEATRRSIENLTAEIGTVQAAGVPAEVAIARMRAQIEMLSEAGRPSVASLVDSETGQVRFVTENVSNHILTPAGASVGNTTLVNALGLVAWCMKDEIIARLEEEILDQAQPDALTAQEKAVRVAELTAQIRMLSRVEEESITALEQRGSPVRRREDADPYAVLGVQ